MSARWTNAWILCLVLALSSCHAQLNGEFIELDALLDAAAHDDMRSLLQAGTGSGSPSGGYGAASVGGYGGQQQNEAGPVQQQCTAQVQASTMQVFTAMLEPVTSPQGPEAAQDAAHGMAVVYVDSRSGQAYVTGTVNNIYNLTAITLNAGNSTQVGPVLLPLLPSTQRVNATQGQSTNNANATSANSQGASQSQPQGNNGSQVLITPFSPPLPWLATMQFSEVVPLSSILPLTSNATLNTQGSSSASAGSTSSQGSSNNNSGQQTAAQANPGVPLNYSGNQVGAKPFSFVNVTDLSNRLTNQPAAVTVVSVYLPNGTVITSYNFTNGSGAGATNAGQGSGQNQSTQGVVSLIALMQAGLAYISVHTNQSGQTPDLRGQLIPYGKVVGNSAAVANAFPDALAPSGVYTSVVCRPSPSSTAASQAGGAASNTTGGNNAGVAQEAGSRVQNRNNLLSNATFRSVASQVLPAVSTALTNVTSGNLPGGRTLQGKYGTFAAAVQAVQGVVNGSGGSGAPAGRRLMQAMTSSNVSQLGNGSESGRRPGITVFAPSDNAIASYLQSQGLTQQQLLSNQSRLLELIAYHIVPTQALSSQNLTSRKQGRLQSMLPNNTIGFQSTPSGVVQVMGARGSANVTDANVGVGRVWIHGINQVLIPSTQANTTQQSFAGASGSTGNNTSSRSSGRSRRLQQLVMLAHKAHLV